jgi:hypothetical protein
MYIIDFEVSLAAESGEEAYSIAIDELAGMLLSHKERKVAEIFNAVPNGGVDGAPPTSDGRGWRCNFSIREKRD